MSASYPSAAMWNPSAPSLSLTMPQGESQEPLCIPLSYNPANSQTSASHLIYSLFPEWTPAQGGRGIKFVRFTDGITNTLLKCMHRAEESLSPEEAVKQEDGSAVLLRAFGHDTSILIDRERECSSHLLLHKHNLAPQLLARFSNGLIYRFVPGRVTSVEDLAEPEIFTAVAKRLGEWHGVLPRHAVDGPEPEIDQWGVMQKWIDALPTGNDAEKTRKVELEKELAVLQRCKEDGGNGLKGQDGGVGLVTGHCDLLSGNVIILPGNKAEPEVHFIDYEYATPCERAFDIANHFAEWGGFECDYTKMPSRSVRREFIQAYLESFHKHAEDGKQVTEAEVEQLMTEVDNFRGVPGFYWGIWALIQAMISQIDFDYAAYALVRLGEYHAWKGSESTLREQKWASEV